MQRASHAKNITVRGKQGSSGLCLELSKWRGEQYEREMDSQAGVSRGSLCALARSLDFIFRATGTWLYWLDTHVLWKNRPTMA